MKIIIKLIPYYWIIQGLLIAITIRGLGSLPFIGCILLIVCTILHQKVNAKYTKVFSILYMIYSIILYRKKIRQYRCRSRGSDLNRNDRSDRIGTCKRSSRCGT